MPRYLKFFLLLIAIISGIHFESASRVSVSDLYPESNTIFKDRNENILRWVPAANGERHIWTTLDNIPAFIQNAFISAEDHRFYSHPGIDVLAILRAVKSNLAEGHIVSGASTLTQQLSRLTYPRKRTYYDKLVELIRSLRIESLLDKDQILELYLNRVPLGNNLVGVKSASMVYFGKSLSKLTTSESALLASLPKAPGKLNPYGKNAPLLIERRNWVLKRMHLDGHIDSTLLNLSLKETLDLKPKSFPFGAPHFVNKILSISGKGITKTTLDLKLQKRVQQILKSHQFRLKRGGARQGSVVILDNKNSEILSLAGSIEYSKRHQGFNDGTNALRSPGSTLKPFLFAQALDSGLNTATVLEDIEKKYISPQGIYRPVNFNKKSYGPVSMRNALGNSLNQTAVTLLSRMGYSSFYETLQSLDLINYPHRGPEHYGLGMVIGNPEVTLVQLATAYAAIARGGVFIPAKFFVNDKSPGTVRIYSEEASYILTDMLSDPSARHLTFGDFFNQKLPFKVALKTGTSTNYRDGWIVVYTPKHTIAIWVGNFNGQPTAGMSGAQSAGPILIDILNELYPNGFSSVFPKPEGVVSREVCSYSGMKPNKFCPHIKQELFISGMEPEEICDYHVEPGGMHNLPPQFTTWLHGKYKKGIEGNYRLAGFSRNLEKTFQKENRIRRSSEAIYRHGSLTIQITNPVNGEIYIPNEDSHEIDLEVISSLPVSEITWYIDGIEYDKVGPPYKTKWPFSRGTHTITAIGPDHLGDSISIEIK
ncbi:MAG: penicillin-binding protein 1C [Nitrospinae bacterium]|nr:penicillin-binding protein 1C [Nitrospinota bacterium]